MPDDLQPGRNFVEDVGDVFAKFRKMGAAAARAHIAGRMDDLLARQMLR